jgi:hypothetical protein
MFQIDQPTAVPLLPAPSVAGTQGYFTNGNESTGLASTVVDADFLNMLMSELVNVVLAGGLTPSKTTYNQLLQAILILIQGVSGSANYGIDSGVINAYAATFPAPVLAVFDGLSLSFKAAHANTGPSTFTPNPGVIAPAPVWGGNNTALVGGEIIVGFNTVEWNNVFGAWVMLANPGGAAQLGAGSYCPTGALNDRSLKVVNALWVQRNYKVGEVKMWHGAVAGIAAAWGPGWQLADGTNGTANLKDRFVVGAGNLYAPNAAAGAATVTLATANLPAHNHVINLSDPGHAHGVSDPHHVHGISDPGHAHGVSDPSHNHGLPQTPHAHGVSDPGHAHALQYLGSAQAGDDNGGAATSSPTGFGTSRGIAGTAGAGTGVGIQAQYANVSINAALTGIGIFGAGTGVSTVAAATSISIFAAGSGLTATSNNAGSGTPVASLPPYYALCFIEYTGIGA